MVTTNSKDRKIICVFEEEHSKPSAMIYLSVKEVLKRLSSNEELKEQYDNLLSEIDKNLIKFTDHVWYCPVCGEKLGSIKEWSAKRAIKRKARYQQAIHGIKLIA